MTSCTMFNGAGISTTLTRPDCRRAEGLWIGSACLTVADDGVLKAG